MKAYTLAGAPFSASLHYYNRILASVRKQRTKKLKN